MGGPAMTAEGPATGIPNTSPSSLREFCLNSVSKCFSSDADKRCVPVALCSLSALLLLISCFLLVCQRCRIWAENPREILRFFYSLLGNLCSTVGAVLSTELHLQILMGALASAVDAIHFLSLCFPVLLCWNSKAERKRRMLRARRRQHLLALSVLMVVAGGFLKSTVTHSPADRPPGGRILLQVAFQDNGGILGYILGLLSFVIAVTSRFPSLRRAYRGLMFTWASMTSGLLSSLSGALYAAAILLYYDTQFVFLSRVAPWLLSATCCAALDLLILLVHGCRRTTGRQLTHFSPDTENLLSDPSENNNVMKRQRTLQDLPSPQTKTKNAKSMTEMGRYMDVSVQPLRKEVTLSKKELEGRSLNRTLRTGLNTFCSLDTSCDSSSLSSDLEWDFEEANARWTEPTANQQEGAEFPLQEWPKNPKPRFVRACAPSTAPQNTAPGGEENSNSAKGNVVVI